MQTTQLQFERSLTDGQWRAGEYRVSYTWSGGGWKCTAWHGETMLRELCETTDEAFSVCQSHAEQKSAG